jgi:hypothetical protein
MTQISNERLAEIEAQAWECSTWPEWLKERVDDAMEVSGNVDMSTEQVLAYAILIEQALRASSGVEVKPDFYGVWSGKIHVGTWADENTAREVAEEYDSPSIIPLYASPLPTVEVTATHRHKKRGTEYVLIGIGKMQAEYWEDREYASTDEFVHGTSVDMREVAIYRSATDPNEIWVRPREEFEDGRFEALSQNKGE